MLPPTARVSHTPLLALFVASAVASQTVEQAYPPPAGAERVATDAFGATLKELVLAPPGQPVKLWNGGSAGWERARVVELPLVPGDLQQCADAIIRLRSEWERSQGHEVSWFATSGDPLPWKRYREGSEPWSPHGKRVQWRPATRPATWDGYLAKVFTWAGTASLEQYETRAASQPRAGDVVVEGGFPGHAVLLLDVARRGDQTWVLVGQGFTPAQDFHVLEGPVAGWWPWVPPRFELPSWKLRTDQLRRFREEPAAGGSRSRADP